MADMTELLWCCLNKIKYQWLRARRLYSGTGNCDDNAVAERFFAIVKLEAVQGRVFPTREAARRVVCEYVEVLYNRQRLHSGLGSVCPAHAAA